MKRNFLRLGAVILIALSFGYLSIVRIPGTRAQSHEVISPSGQSAEEAECKKKGLCWLVGGPTSKATCGECRPAASPPDTPTGECC